MRTLQVLIVVLLVGSLSACVSYRSYRQAQLADQTGDWDKAVLFYMKASRENPNNIAYRAALLRARAKAAQAHFDKARKYQENRLLERSLVEYQQAVALDPSNQSALVELDRVREEIKSRDQGRGPATIAEMKERAAARNQPPTLNPRSNEPIDLEFPKPASIQTIYKALGDAFGINVLFDPNLKDQEIPLVLKQVVAQDALEFLMRAAGHFYKVMDEHTIIVAADTPQNRRNYQDLVIKTFFLSNAEVKDVVTMLRSLIDAKKIATNEQLNAIILRDTADKVKVAERIIRANDKARAEVVVDIELLQINSSKLLDLGVTWPSQITAGLDTGGGGDSPLRLSDIEFLDQSNWAITIPSFVYDFVKTSTDAQLLAKPQLRISEGERASLTIGDRVPVPVTSFNTGNTVGGNIVPITSFQYQDVGIQISIEPRVHHNKEVTLAIQVEVSNLSGEVISGGQSQPIIGTRNFESTIRLKDGETNFLAGLLRTDETRSESGVPGLSELPIIGRLFGSTRNNNQRTDVILTITPRIIRSADITPEDLEPIWVGTESNITFRGGSPRVESNVEGPFDRQAGSSAEDIRELIQRRIQRLPRGLRSQGGQVGNGQPVEEPGGVELVPADPPANLFNDPPADQEDQGNGFRVPNDRRSDDEDQPRNRSRNGSRNRPQADNDPPPSPFGGNNASSTSRLGMDPANTMLAAVRPTPTTVPSFSSAASKVSLVNAVGTQEEAQVRLSLSPRGLWARPGDLFEVTLQVDSSIAVSHLPVTLGFDSTVLAVEGVRPGDFFGEAAQAQILTDFSRPGELVIGASRLGDVEGVSGAGTLVHITFRAVATGTAEIGFSTGRAMGSKLEEIAPVLVEPAAIEVRDAPGPVDKPDRPKPPHET